MTSQLQLQEGINLCSICGSSNPETGTVGNGKSEPRLSSPGSHFPDKRT